MYFLFGEQNLTRFLVCLALYQTFIAIKAAALNEDLHIPLTYTRSLHDDGEVWNSDSMCGLVFDSDGKLTRMFIAVF